MDFIGGLIGLSILQVVLLAVGATVGAICFAVAAMFTRTAAPSLSKRAVLLASFLFPMVSLFYLEAGLFIPTILQSARGDGYLHHPMANGYELIFYDPVAFDETSHEDCYVWDPAGRQLMVSEIYGVQVFNDYLFIHAAADDSPRIGFNVTAVHGFPAPSPAASRTPDRYFEIDTKTGDITDYRDEQDLRVASAQRGIMLHLTSTLDVYRETLARGRPHWTFNVILLIPLAAGAIWLLGKILQLRRSSTT